MDPTQARTHVHQVMATTHKATTAHHVGDVVAHAVAATANVLLGKPLRNPQTTCRLAMPNPQTTCRLTIPNLIVVASLANLRANHRLVTRVRLRRLLRQ